jgi:NADH-quinone oxidoreductase subunit J
MRMVETVLFALIGLVAVAAAIGVVWQRKVIYSGLLLVLNFLCLAALYILMNAQFVGVAQIIVYAGALMVMFLFTVMLLAGKRDEGPSQRLRLQGPAAIALIVLLGAMLVLALAAPFLALTGPATTSLGGTVEAIGEALFTRYLWALLATGVLLLVAVVGVVYLARGAGATKGLVRGK